MLAWGGLGMVVFLALFWPFGQGVRYLLPLLPVLWLGVWRAMPGGWPRAHVLGVLLCLHLAAAVVFQLDERGEGRAEHRRWPGVLALVEPVRGGAVGNYRLTGLEPHEHRMLRLALDRAVLHVGPARLNEEPRARWAFLGDGRPVPPGWRVDAAAAGIKRLVRE